MKNTLGLLGLLLVVGCGTSKEQRTAYREAQAGARKRLEAREKAFRASVEELAAGRWVPHAELGACADAPPDGWVVDPPSDRWDLVGRVFEAARGHIGPPERAKQFSDAAQLEAATQELLTYEADQNVTILFVDSLVKPRATSETSFAAGHESGRAWVWSGKRLAIVCAGTFEASTPERVEVTHRGGRTSKADEVASDLLVAMRRESQKDAREKLVAAGPP